MIHLREANRARGRSRRSRLNYMFGAADHSEALIRIWVGELREHLTRIPLLSLFTDCPTFRFHKILWRLVSSSWNFLTLFVLSYLRGIRRTCLYKDDSLAPGPSYKYYTFFASRLARLPLPRLLRLSALNIIKLYVSYALTGPCSFIKLLDDSARFFPFRVTQVSFVAFISFKTHLIFPTS